MVSPRVFSVPQVKFTDPSESFSIGSKSPTFNRKSHDRWGSHHRRSLDELHKSESPTHWATLKFNRLESVGTMHRLLDSLGDAVRYLNNKEKGKQSNKRIAMFGIMNPEKDSSIHYHVLIRSSIPDTAAFITAKIASHNRKYGTIATLSYLKPPTNVKAITAYPFKQGSPTKLLIHSHSGLRHVFQCGKYFGTKHKRALERANFYKWQNKTDKRLTRTLFRLEAKVAKILCTFESFVTPKLKRVLERANFYKWQNKKDKRLTRRLFKLEAKADKILCAFESFVTPQPVVPTKAHTLVAVSCSRRIQTGLILLTQYVLLPKNTPRLLSEAVNKAHTPNNVIIKRKSPPRIRSPCRVAPETHRMRSVKSRCYCEAYGPRQSKRAVPGTADGV